MSCKYATQDCFVQNFGKWLSAIFVILVFAGIVSAQIPISSCQTITASGSYILTNNLSSSTSCILIAANNVTIDCNGARIVGPGPNVGGVYGIRGGGGVAGSANNTIIKNCIIENFQYGIGFHGVTVASNPTVINSTLINNRFGTFFNQMYAYVYNSTFINNTETGIHADSGALAVGNKFLGNRYEMGGSLINSSNNTLLDSCKIPYQSLNLYQFHSNVPLCPGTYNYTDNAILLVEPNITVDCNGATLIGPGPNSGRYGIYSGWPGPAEVSNPTIKNCIISNFTYGISFRRCQNPTIINNTLINNREGVLLTGLSSSHPNEITLNTFANNQYGISLQGGIVRFYKNNLYNNTVYDLVGDLDFELSYNRQGNWWGRTSPPYFVAGVDTNRLGLIDSYPYQNMNGWLIRDTDNDGIRDDIDNCPTVYNPDQADRDHNGIGDACQDVDNDSIIDINDNCPLITNPDQADFDRDGLGNVCDPDADGDGIANEIDRNRITGQDLSLVPSNNFNDLTTFGYIAERGTWNVSIVDLPAPNGVRVSISGNGSGNVRIISCNNLVETTLDQAGETADITCGSTTVLAGLAKPFIDVRKPDSSVKGKAIKIKLNTNEKVTLGSPISAAETNTEPIDVQIVDEDDSIYAYLMLEPGQIVDIIPEDPATNEPVIVNLAETPITVIFVYYGINITLQPGQSFADSQPPVTTASYYGLSGSNEWFTSDVSIILSANDDASGVKEIRICVDRDNQCEPTEGSSTFITEEGVWYVRYYSIDNARKVERLHSDVIKIDKTPPEITLIDLPSYDTDGLYVLNWTASDNIATTFIFNIYRNGELYLTTTNTSIVEQIATEGFYNYYVEVVDWAGLRSISNNVSTVVDLTPPSAPILVPLPQYTAKPFVKLQWAVAEAQLEDIGFYSLYKNANRIAQLSPNVFSYTDIDVGDGRTYNYRISATDKAGLESELSEEVSTTIDLTPPNTIISIDGILGSNGWYTSDIGVTLSASDATSGVSQILYRINNGDWMVYTGTFEIGEGMHTIEYYSIDMAGNREETKNIRVKIDKTAPLSRDNIPERWINTDFNVQISSSDNLSGLAVIYSCSTTGEDCTPIPGQSSFWFGEGIHKIKYYATDIAGNAEVIRHKVVRIDKTAPVTTPLETGVRQESPFTNIFKDKAIVSFTAVDSLSKINAIYYCIDTSNMCQPDKIVFKCDSLSGDCPEDARGFIEVTQKGTSFIRFFSEDRAGNREEIQSINVTIDIDSDKDGVYDNFDACPRTAGIISWQGCNYADLTKVKLDIIDQTLSGICVDKRGRAVQHCTINIEGAAVKIFNRTDPAFIAAYGRNPKGTDYGRIFESSIGWVGKDIPIYSAQRASCFTNSSGRCIAGETAVGDYLVIVKFRDPVTNKTIYAGKNKDEEDFRRVLFDDYEDDDESYERTTPRLAAKSIRIIKHIDKRGQVTYHPAKKLVVLGSQLDVVTPDYTIWDGKEYVYPFIFTSEDEWTVDVCLYVPEGYKIAEGYNCTQTFIANETKVVTFTVKEMSSPDPNVNVEIKAEHRGTVKTVSIQIPGQRMRGIDLTPILQFAILLLIVASLVYLLKKNEK
ncbi:MAG: thrombospondin type 3 repeat-containing protein [Candidatus Micrarchaeota archaeon]|nr:thrombospondin type 3 repeat-containing protein [Candidatus Micrarchaeota archaeon]